MGSPYTSVSVSNYNSNPPSDDGASVPSNEITWSKHKTKLADPLKTALESVNTNVVTAVGKLAGGVTSVATDYTVLAADQGKLVVVTASATVTTPDATVVTGAFKFGVLNNSSAIITVDGSGSQTVDGAATIKLQPGRGAILDTDGSNWFTHGQNNREVGEIIDYAGSTAPTGWLLCYGQAVSRTTYAALFAVLSTTFGSGDGSTTFNVPDLRGRVVAGKDNMGGFAASRLTTTYAGFVGTTLGAVGGDERLQAHAHGMPINHTSGSDLGISTFNGTASNPYVTNSAGAGSSQNVQPTIILNKIIYAGV